MTHAPSRAASRATLALLVSIEMARELYGVALTADFKVNEAETETLRTQVAAE